jgi:hypothetical protein
MKTAKQKTSKKQPPVLINQQELINRLLKSISNYSGFSEEYIKDGTEHLCSHWRKIGMYILVKKYGFTYENAGKVFGKKAPHCHIVVKEITKLLTTEGKKHLASPFVNKFTFDMEL